jgi:hypothetical protein
MCRAASGPRPECSLVRQRCLGDEACTDRLSVLTRRQKMSQPRTYRRYAAVRWVSALTPGRQAYPHWRSHCEGPSLQYDAENAGYFAGRTRPNGGPAQARIITRSSSQTVTSVILRCPLRARSIGNPARLACWHPYSQVGFFLHPTKLRPLQPWGFFSPWLLNQEGHS